MKVMAAMIGAASVLLFGVVFSAEGTPAVGKDDFYAELNRLRNSAWQQRAESIAKMEALRQPGLDELHGFCLESAVCEILAKSRPNRADIDRARDEARQQLKRIHAGFPAHSRHPYRLLLDLRLLPDREADDFPSAEVMAQVETLLRERYLDRPHEPTALHLERDLGHELAFLCEARHRKDLLRAGGRSQEGRLEALVGMLTLEQLKALSAPGWLLSAQARRTKAYMNARGFLEGDKATLALLDDAITGTPAAPPAAATAVTAADASAVIPARSEEAGKSPWDRPWLVLVGLVAVIGGGIAWALGRRAPGAIKKP